MNIAQRGRVLAVSGFVLGGGVSIVASTQTWVRAELVAHVSQIDVPGASALALLTPLSLMVLALGAAVALVGPVLRIIAGALGLLAALTAGIQSAQLLWAPPLSAVARSVTEATGLAGERAISGIVEGLSPTGWPVVAVVGWIVVAVASVWTIVTGRRWKEGGRRFRTASPADTSRTGPVDALESWDDLSRGTDPTR